MMADALLPAGSRALLPAARLGDVLRALREDGYTLIGPTVRDGAIVYAEIGGIDDLPAGGPRRRRPGRTGCAGATTTRSSATPSGRTPGSSSSSCRGCGCGGRGATGPASRSTRRRAAPPRLALIGARSCDLHAIAIQDRIFLARPVRRPGLRRAARGRLRRRRQLRPGGRHVLLRLDGDRAARHARLRPRAHRAARRPAPLPRRGRQRARRGAARPRRRASRRPTTTGTRPTRSCSARRAAWAARSTRAASRSCSTATSSIRAGTTSPRAASPAPTARSSARPASARRSRTSPT